MKTAVQKFTRVYRRAEDIAALVLLVLLALLPAAEVFIRKIFNSGIEGQSGYVAHLVLLITFVGGMITARENQHLAVATFLHMTKGRLQNILRTANAFIASALTVAFGWASLSLIFNGFGANVMIGVIPVQVLAFIIPIGYFVIAARLILSARLEKTGERVAWFGFLAGTLFSLSAIFNIIAVMTGGMPDVLQNIINVWTPFLSMLTPALIVALILAGIFGTPLYVVLGGIAYFLFVRSGGAVEVLPNESYTLLIGNSIPAIPLFTFVGFILSESKAGERLIRLFQALFGWLKGGMVIVAVIVSAFFTTFTGASGVTILALGGILFYVLSKSGKFKESYSTGLLTAVGSIGLLFPPSLPIILYGSQARVSILDLFIGGMLPGVLMLIAMSVTGVASSIKNKIPTTPFSLKEAGKSVLESIWELLLPVLIVALYFSGTTSLVETGALAVLYALVIEVFVHKDIKIRDLPQVAKKGILIIGGVLLLLGLARALSYYIIDAEIPTHLSRWVQAHIHSKYLFLLVLNLALLVVGCFMDVFSAILVVVPLIIPLGEIFQIHPVHLGIIFLANLELGFLTPPIGLNLFLSSYRFEKPLLTVVKNVMPFFLIQLVILALITYVPAISTWLLSVVKFKIG